MPQIQQIATVSQVLLSMFVKEVDYLDDFDMGDYMGTQTRTIAVFNHGPFSGPLASACAMISRMNKLGFGHKRFNSIAHPIVMSFPGLAKALGLPMHGKKRFGVEDYIQLFEDNQMDFLGVAPEGEYSMYGNGLDVQPFRSPKSIEIALRARCDIMLVICKGFEKWQKTINIQQPWRKKLLKSIMLAQPFVDKIDDAFLKNADHYGLPWLMTRIPHLTVYTKRYYPQLQAEDLGHDPKVRRQQLQVEADRMRSVMQDMVNQLKQRP
ncbi:MAG: hypothetical protein HQM12_08050 [SAR324 cluster bacterium]|nr:hypothetical protein [SAR324 cluster bacterium]